MYVVDRLIKERRVSGREVARIALEMNREISDLERRLAQLRADSGPRSSARRAPAGPTRRKSRPVNAAVAASRRLQGEYMGLMRHVSSRERARMKKIAAEQGREAAVKAMRTHLGR
ncbi:MAG: hypothetical protein ABIR92_02825 [Gemmatimonadaceae bacterium]